MKNLRTTGDQQFEAQRWAASQASREVAELDVLSVYYVVQAKITEGRMDEAKQIYLDYKAGK